MAKRNADRFNSLNDGSDGSDDDESDFSDSDDEQSESSHSRLCTLRELIKVGNCVPMRHAQIHQSRAQEVGNENKCSPIAETIVQTLNIGRTL